MAQTDERSCQATQAHPYDHRQRGVARNRVALARPGHQLLRHEQRELLIAGKLDAASLPETVNEDGDHRRESAAGGENVWNEGLMVPALVTMPLQAHTG